jgi:two-component system sensor histidine kinase CreC
MTHAIKTPLTAIRGAAELLRESMPSEDREAFLGNILSGTERIRDTVDRMLPLAALEARHELEKPELIFLETLIGTLAEERRPDFESVGKKFLVRSETDPRVRGDNLLLREAIGNLIQNSLEFSSLGGVVELRVSKLNAFAVIEVLDDGPGIPHYALDRVFDRFFSLPRPNNGDRSSGLVLSLVREITHLHGVTAVITNRDGHGAIARFSIPLVDRG